MGKNLQNFCRGAYRHRGKSRKINSCKISYKNWNFFEKYTHTYRFLEKASWKFFWLHSWLWGYSIFDGIIAHVSPSLHSSGSDHSDRISLKMMFWSDHCDRITPNLGKQALLFWANILFGHFPIQPTVRRVFAPKQNEEKCVNGFLHNTENLKK